MTDVRYAYRRAGGSSLLLALVGEVGETGEVGEGGGSGTAVPVVLHWGADLGDLDSADVAVLVAARTERPPHSALDAPRWLSILPESVTGFTGTPAIEGLRPARESVAWAPRFAVWRLEERGDRLTLTSDDEDAGLAVTVALELTSHGVVRTRTQLTNTAQSVYVVSGVRSVLPVGPEAGEVLDLTGRWTRERSPQRRPFGQGAWTRSGRHGRTGHDATLLMVAGTPAFGFRTGTVWGVHVAWSGDHVHYAERTPEGESLLGGGELLGPGEVTLSPGESYTSPWLVGSWSDQGLDGMSGRLHAWHRDNAPAARTPRPVLINTWEAVYFDHDLGRLTELADAAAEVGVERFVLDDGWFRGRRDDHAGLGDWTVDPAVWPKGLHPLIDHVHSLGMDFGLWVEPEMVNLDSDLARAHPDWVLKGRRTLPTEWRFQQVLDLQNPDAYEHVRTALHAILDEYDIAFLKWDHNRDLVDIAHAGGPAVHGQTEALYRLLDDLQRSHPMLEIETCASGGGRVDFGILQRTQRLWASDTIDALERQYIQRWTTLLVPPEVMGAHIGGPVAHTTGRRHGLGFRAATALLGHLGIEWDITRAGPAERAELAEWVEVHKSVRRLVAEGVLVRGDHPDPSLLLSGVVSSDRTAAVFVLASVASSLTQTPVLTTFPGLDPGRHYRAQRLGPASDDHASEGAAWLRSGEPIAGSLLGTAGVRLPPFRPETAVVVHLEAC